MAQNFRTTTTPSDDHWPVDLAYRELSGWTSRPEHCATRAEAERLRDATDSLAPAAAARRTWTITPCRCGDAG